MPDLFSIFNVTQFTTVSYLLSLLAALVCGVISAFAASFKTRASKSFIASLILLPLIVETVIIMVNGNVGTGVAVMGAFSLVRFRSAPGRARDIVSIFISMTAGLACAAGYAAVALVFCVAVGAVMVIIALVPMKADRLMELRITVPETLNYSGVFDDEFEKYTRFYKLVSIKTTNMGSLFKLIYKVELKDISVTKDFIDRLRIKNGNLEISIAEATERGDEL